ncbi:MAG TPA: V-type ATP synthase subunit A [Streptosporangiaceae bacterium]|nr:V-type ATP synthase subunit A [Streptosporangiaceae bacterium]
MTAGQDGRDPVPATADGARVVRVNGPLVEVDGLAGAAMYDIVEVGRDRLPGEVVSIRGALATIQAYEYTGGLAPGDPASARHEPLSARLGPHLLGGVFDGLLRPLSGAPAWLRPGHTAPDGQASYRFTPAVTDGATAAEGSLLGTVSLRSAIAYRVLAPPGVSGPVTAIRPPGPVGSREMVARVGSNAVRLESSWPVRRPRPFRERLDGDVPLVTGQRAVDMLFPVTRGGTAAVPGGFGTGKTVLLQQIAKWCDADVIVYVGCGERGNELAELLTELTGITDPRTGGRLADRTVVIANTSNMPMMAREASIYSAAAVAEHFRDMGLDTVIIADSTSRWAEALREFASRTGELPAEEGYPASLSSALAAFYERAGRVVTTGGEQGSVTIVGAISPAGGDMTEPVTAQTQRYVRCLWSLDRDLAYARHYPALSWSGSYSRDAPSVGAWHAREQDPGWPARRSRLAATLAEADRLGALAELMGPGALPPRERVTLLAGRLIREAVLQQSALSPADSYCDAARGAALAGAVLAVADRCQELAAAGMAPAAIEEADFSPVLRAREEAATPAEVDQRRDAMLARLAALAREQQVPEVGA